MSKVKAKFGTLSMKPCGHDTDHSFALLLSIFTCKFLFYDESRKPIDFGSWIKGRGEIWHSMKPYGHDTEYYFCCITFNFT